jgi:hypothetical protein
VGQGNTLRDIDFHSLVVGAFKAHRRSDGSPVIGRVAEALGADRRTVRKYYDAGIPASADAAASPPLRAVLAGDAVWPPVGWQEPPAVAPAASSAPAAPAAPPAPLAPAVHAAAAAPAAPVAPAAPPARALIPSESPTRVEIARQTNVALAELEAAIPATLRREALAAKAGLELAIGYTDVSLRLLAPFPALSQALSKSLESMAADGTVSAAFIARTLARLVKIAEAASRLTEAALRNRRLLSGVPQTVTEMRHVSGPTEGFDGGFDPELLAKLEEIKRRAEALEVEAMPPDAQYSGEQSGEGFGRP